MNSINFTNKSNKKFSKTTTIKKNNQSPILKKLIPSYTSNFLNYYRYKVKSVSPINYLKHKNKNERNNNNNNKSFINNYMKNNKNSNNNILYIYKQINSNRSNSFNRSLIYHQ